MLSRIRWMLDASSTLSPPSFRGARQREPGIHTHDIGELRDARHERLASHHRLWRWIPGSFALLQNGFRHFARECPGMTRREFVLFQQPRANDEGRDRQGSRSENATILLRSSRRGRSRRALPRRANRVAPVVRRRCRAPAGPAAGSAAAQARPAYRRRSELHREGPADCRAAGETPAAG